MTVAMVAIGLLAFSLCLLAVEGAHVCRIRGPGQISQIGGVKFGVKMPCKYIATDQQCEGYNIRVSPGQAFDSRARYYPDTVWISIQKLGTSRYWKGRTTTVHVDKHFEKDGREPFSVMEDKSSGADGFTVRMTSIEEKRSVTVSVKEANFKVTYFAYDEKVKKIRKNVGIRIYCPSSFVLQDYHFPDSMCGSVGDNYSVAFEKTELGMASRNQMAIFHVLNNQKIKQINPQCETATSIFSQCDMEDRIKYIQQCSDVIVKASLARCLHVANLNPMDVFIYCMDYKCKNKGNSCELLKDAADVCPGVASALPQNGQCPAVNV